MNFSFDSQFGTQVGIPTYIPSLSGILPGIPDHIPGIVRNAQNFLKIAEMSSQTELDGVPSARDVYNDYMGFKKGIKRDPNMVKWRLKITATPEEYSLWEAAMERGIELCSLKI